MSIPEHRAGCEFRVAGRTLSGVVMRYGDTSPEYRERFVPGAFSPIDGVSLNIQHDQRLRVLDPGAFILTDTMRELRIRAELPAGSAALSLVQRGALNGYSVEFHARAERREAGVRVIERAVLVGIGLVDQPSYPQSTAEVRARSGRTLRSRIPYDESLACECIARSGPGSGGACVPLARFTRVAGDAMAEAINGALAEAVDVLAIAGSYRRPLGSASRRTLRATSTEQGLDVEIDLPAGAVGDEIVAAHEAAGVIVRPLVDAERSEYTDTDRGREYSRPYLRALLVGATDVKTGWPIPAIEYDGERAAPAPERRRQLWL